MEVNKIKMCWMSFGNKWEYMPISELQKIKKGIDYKVRIDWNTMTPVYEYLK